MYHSMVTLHKSTEMERKEMNRIVLQENIWQQVDSWRWLSDGFADFSFCITLEYVVGPGSTLNT